jgi:tetratricopeptide (TPR) repeat protein
MEQKDADPPAGAFSADLSDIAALLGADPASAAGRAEEAFKLAPGQRDALMLFVSARRLAGDLSSARDVLQALAVAEPKLAAVQYELGLLLIDMNDSEGAIAALSRAVEAEPAHPDAWRALGDRFSKAGRIDAAAFAYAKHFEIRGAEFRRMESLTASDDRFAAADPMLRTLLETHPTDVVAMWMLAGVHIRRDCYEDAERLLKRALQLAPSFSAARNMLAKILFRYAKHDEVLQELDVLLGEAPDNPDYLRLKATTLLMQAEYDQSISGYETLIARNPQLAILWAEYGHALKTVGRQKDAVTALRRAIALQPSLGDAWWTLASLRTFRFTSDDIETMRKELGRKELGGDERIRMHHALGKALEDEKNYIDSFGQYALGNALRRKAHPYNARAEAEALKRAKAAFTRVLFNARSGAGSQARDPIFIVGMTRAGSTLVEQILASHSMVEGTKELEIVTTLIGRLNDPQRRPALPYPEILGSVDPKEYRQLGEAYLERARPHRKLDRPFFIDKTPGNFQHLGFIHLILPNAKIIDVRRHPLGCGFANFRQYYRYSQAFASDLTDIGHFYRGYVELTAHFDSMLPGIVHRVFYEDLVADPEAEIRRLIDYLGLPFEETCLRFFETKRAVLTPSSEQVRQPMFTEGIEQWRHYEPWLGPLKSALGDVLESYPAIPDFSAKASAPAQSWAMAGQYRWLSAGPQAPADKR